MKMKLEPPIARSAGPGRERAKGIKKFFDRVKIDTKAKKRQRAQQEKVERSLDIPEEPESLPKSVVSEQKRKHKSGKLYC